MKKMKILVLHGPNLNLLGEREPRIYGKTTLKALNRVISAEAHRLKQKVRIYQRNGEGELIDLIHKYRRWADGILINPAAYTHYSYALRDALNSIDVPSIEVHMSDIRRREAWRRKSVTRDACRDAVIGKGPASYLVGLRKLKTLLS